MCSAVLLLSACASDGGHAPQGVPVLACEKPPVWWKAAPSYGGEKLTAVCGNVYADPSVARSRWPALMDAIAAAQQTNRKFYGTLVAEQPDVIVCNTAACIDHFAGPPQRNVMLHQEDCAGQYVAPQPTVVLLSATSKRNPDVLAHEFSHAEVAARLAGQRVPAWFNEGVATYVADEPACEHVTQPGIADLRQLDREQDWTAYTQPRDKLARTYCQARAEIAAWTAARGNAAVLQLLDAVRRGQPFDDLYGPMLTQ